MTKEITIQELARTIEEGFSKMATKEDLTEVRKDIKAVHQDLIAHDQRADEMMNAISELGDIHRLRADVDTMRRNIRDKLHVEV